MDRFSQALGKVPTIVIDEPGRSDWEIEFDDKGILCLMLAKSFNKISTSMTDHNVRQVAEELMHLKKDQLKNIFRNVFHSEYVP
jgi:hypothetical protein